MFKWKIGFSKPALASVLVTIVTTIWVYLISDNPVQLALSLIIGLCCGVVSYFVLTNEKNLVFRIDKFRITKKQVLLLLFLLFLVTFAVSPINSVFVADWFSIPALNWLSYILTLIFTLFVPGFVILNLIGVYRKVHFLATIVFSVLISMYVTSVFWYFCSRFALSNTFSLLLFEIFQFAILFFYVAKLNVSNKENSSEVKPSFSLNALWSLVAIVAIFVSLIALQEFVYQPFARGDSWDYVGTSLAISKGAFNLAPAGNFYVTSTPNFFETYLSAITNFSGFPPVNAFLVLTVLFAVLIPVAFYVMCRKYVANSKISVLSTFIFVVASGFGWIPFISQKLSAYPVSYSPETLSGVLSNFAPQVIYDITQPQGIFSEGLKTYAFGLLAIMMVIYLFNTEVPTKVRVSLIALFMAFAFQFHIEEALIFTVAIIPAFVIILLKKEKAFVRWNLVGVGIGLAISLLFELASEHTSLTSYVFESGLLSVFSLGLWFSLTFLKIDKLIESLRGVFKKYKVPFFLIICYLAIFSVYVLVFYGYPNINADYSANIVYTGLDYPWYYYPLALGIVGVLMLVGLLMNFQEDRKISLILLMVICLIIFGKLLSIVNVNLFLTGTKEWRVLYRILPIPASIFAGWVSLKLIKYSKESLKEIRVSFRNKSHAFPVNSRALSAIVLVSIIIFGIPSTIIASEYWMSSGVNPRGDIHPQAADLELANFFSTVPLTSRAAVSSYDANAMIRLAGGTTAITDLYLDFLGLNRPETVAMLSSDIKYVVLDKTQSFDTENFPMLNYLSVVFNNSKYLVYQLPTLQAPSIKSSIGYVAPLQYNDETLASFFAISSLGTPYQVVNNDFSDKSVLLLPSDPSIVKLPALRFDGINDDVELGNIAIPSEFTVSAWFKTPSTGYGMSIISKRVSGPTNPGFRVLILDNNKISAEINDGEGTIAVIGGEHNDNLWHNVIAVFGQRYLSLYVDGRLEGRTEIPRELGSVNNDLHLTIGSDNGQYGYFDGFISNVCIYDRSLNENEIGYNLVSFNDTPIQDGLYFWLPMNEGTGFVLNDGWNTSSLGWVRGATWSNQQVPSNTRYGSNIDSLMSWVNGGGKLVVFGGKGEIYDALGLNEKSGYLNVNSVGTGSESFLLNETLAMNPLSGPSNMTALSYYQFNGKDISPFAVEEAFGQGSVVYFNINPLLALNSNVEGGLLFGPNFASVFGKALEVFGIQTNPQINSETVPTSQRWMSQYVGYATDSFAATGHINVNSTLSGSYFLPTPVLADNLVVSKNGGNTSFEKLTIDSITIKGQATLEAGSSGLFLVDDRSAIPNYIPFQFSNCSITLKPVGNSSVQLQTSKGLFVGRSGDSIVLDSKAALLVVKDPSVYINGNTTLTVPGGVNGVLNGITNFHIAYGDSSYIFFDQLESPLTQSSYPQEFALPWQDILLSPFNIVLVCSVIFVAFRLRKYYK